MKTFWCGVGAVMLASLVAAAQGPGPKAAATEQDKAAVRQAAYDYGEGFYEGAAERMERGVHPSIIKRGVVSMDGRPLLMPMNAETLVEITRRNAAKPVPPAERAIAFGLLDIRDNVASAKIFTAQFNDYLHLVKQDGRWRIAHVLWQPPSPQGVTNGEAARAEVAQAVKDYVEALGAGDAARVERLTHPEAALREFRPSRSTGRFFLAEGNRDGALAAVGAKRVPPFQSPSVVVLDVYDTIASALMTTSTGMAFYWHLARQNDQWRVVNLLMR